MRRHLFGLIALAACSGPGAPSPPSAPAPSSVAAARTEGAEESDRVIRRPLVEAREEALPIHLVPSRDRRACLVVHDDPEHVRSYFRRIDESGLGPLQVVDGRRVLGSVELPSGPRIVASDGRRLCIDEHCHEVRASFVLALGERRLAMLEERAVAEVQKEEHRGPSKQKPDEDDEAPPEVTVRIHPLDESGAADGDPYDSGLRFVRPLDGMGVIDAIATPEGAVLLHYAEAKPRREGRREVERAKLMTTALDAEGKRVSGSSRVVFEGDRRFGYIEGHHRQRLFRLGAEVVIVGRRVDRSGARFEAHRRDGTSISATDAIFGVDPARLAAAIDDDLGTRLGALYDLAPRLVVGQPGSDAGRVAWVGERGWFLRDGVLQSTEGEAETLTARRARIAWAHLEPNGEGIAATDAGLVRIEADGSTALAGEAVVLAAPPVRIGESYWAIRRSGAPSGAALVRLFPDRADGPAVAPGETALGAGGLLLRRRGGALRIERLASDGTITHLATHPSPFSGRFAAAATVVAGERDGELLVASVDEKGAFSSLASLGEGRLERLVARPDGVLLVAAARFVWLDHQARPIAAAARAPARAVPCIDGRPLPEAVPLGPGVMQPLAALDDACVVSEVVALADGTLRWIGSRVAGADAEAELVQIAPSRATETKLQPPRAEPRALAGAVSESPCPPEMVAVGSFCIDRFEARLAGADGTLLSPDYPPSSTLVSTILKAWAFGRFYEGDLHARAMPLPLLGRAPETEPTFVARSERGVEPSGFLSGYAAKKACEAAGKRLCRHEEWVFACRGEAQTKFPYGDDYEHGACNVFRFDHPARILHGNAAVGHLDPRLNRVAAEDGPMRHLTGDHPRCASRWGDDAVYDMVGNMDEWVDHKGGAFAGGFYARATRQGCDAVISVHPRRYLDYSLGVRCCLTAR